jgi:hypothetical protein
MASCHTLDQLDTCFDDTHAVANAGLLAASLAERLGIEQAADALIDLGERAGAHRPGRKLLTLVHAMLAGGDGSTTPTCCPAAPQPGAGPAGHGPLHARDLLARLHLWARPPAGPAHRARPCQAWAAGAGPGDGPMTIDLDSAVCEVHGHAKQGAALRLHPPLGTTRCWPAAPTAARSCTPASGPGGPTPPAAPPAWSRSWPPGSAAPAPAAS